MIIPVVHNRGLIMKKSLPRVAGTPPIAPSRAVAEVDGPVMTKLVKSNLS
jgi:hypothetical protein